MPQRYNILLSHIISFALNANEIKKNHAFFTTHYTRIHGMYPMDLFCVPGRAHISTIKTNFIRRNGSKFAQK